MTPKILHWIFWKFWVSPKDRRKGNQCAFDSHTKEGVSPERLGNQGYRMALMDVSHHKPQQEPSHPRSEFQALSSILVTTSTWRMKVRKWIAAKGCERKNTEQPPICSDTCSLIYTMVLIRTKWPEFIKQWKGKAGKQIHADCMCYLSPSTPHTTKL